MKDFYDVVVVGAGSAGFHAAVSARAAHPAATVLLINDEDRPPYRRTRVSKRIKQGLEPAELELQPPEWYQQQGIELLTGHSAARIDRDTHAVHLASGETAVGYGSLILATGGEPLFPKVVRPHERGSFLVVRTASDGLELRRRAEKAKSVLIAGMGILAVELANQLSQMGKQVTLAGATPQLMPRQLTARGGEILEEALMRQKVKLLFQEEILSFERDNKKAWSVQMLKHSGHYDIVLFCIGVQPRTSLAREAGLEVNRGIVVDRFLRTTDPRILACGDCAELPGGVISYLWREAEAQGRAAGANAVSEDAPYQHAPLRLESEVFGQHVVSIGKPRDPWQYRIEELEEAERYLALYWRDERLAGAVAFNRADDAEALESAVRQGAERSALDAAILSP